MTINYQFGDVDAHGALIRAQAASLEAEHQAIIRDVLAAGDFWGGQRPRPKGANRRLQHGQHRLRRRLQLGLTAQRCWQATSVAA